MKQAVLYAVFLFMKISVFGQADSALIQTRYTEYKYRGQIHEKYYVRLPDSVLHGPYEEYATYRKLKVSGSHKNGKRSGVWVYYDSWGEVIKKLDWDNRKVLFWDTLKEPEPYYFNGFDGFLYDLKQKLNEVFPYEKANKHCNDTVHITFELDDNGQRTNYITKEEKYRNTDIEKKIISAFNILPAFQWRGKTPVSDEKVTFKFTCPIIFQNCQEED